MAEFAEAEKSVNEKATHTERKANRTNIPTGVKERIEGASGVSLDDVKVHYHSDKPGLVGALAFTQGNQVYMGTGQEKYLSHELGHVVQQKMGMVQPTRFENGYAINDDGRLERQADEIGKGNVSFGGSAGKGKGEGWTVQMATATLSVEDAGDREDLQSIPAVTGQSAGGGIKRAVTYSFFCTPINDAFGKFIAYSYVNVEYLKKVISYKLCGMNTNWKALEKQKNGAVHTNRNKKGNRSGKSALRIEEEMEALDTEIEDAEIALDAMDSYPRNVWEGIDGEQYTVGSNYAKKYIGENGIYTRNPYYCAEPHALAAIMPLYKQNRGRFLDNEKKAAAAKQAEQEADSEQGKIAQKEIEDYDSRIMAVNNESYKYPEERGALKEFLSKLKFTDVKQGSIDLPPCPVCRQWVRGLGEGKSKLKEKFTQSLVPDINR